MQKVTDLNNPPVGRISFNSHSRLGFRDYLIMLLPLLGLVKVMLIGELFVHEVILLVAVPLFLINLNAASNSFSVKVILFFCGLWLFGQIITDLVRETPPEDYLRGWAKIIFFLGAFFVLSRLIDTPTRALLWLGASSIPMLLRPFLLFEDRDWFVMWKFGVGPALLTIAILPFLWQLHRDPENTMAIRRIAWLYIGFGFISFYFNARSFAGISLLIGLLVWFYPLYRYRKLSSGDLIAGFVTVCATLIMVVSIYSAGSKNGAFGEEARLKYESQMMYSDSMLDVFIGGRSESLVSTIAITDSPIIGHGSWAKNYHYAALYLELRARFSEVNPLALQSEDIKDGLIPSHSYLLGAWVESGILGALFWIVVILICLLKVIPCAVLRGDLLGLIVITTLPSFIWNVLFSPFGANVRVDAAGTLAIILLTLSHKYHSKVMREL